MASPTCRRRRSWDVGRNGPKCWLTEGNRCTIVLLQDEEGELRWLVQQAAAFQKLCPSTGWGGSEGIELHGMWYGNFAGNLGKSQIEHGP